jgi:uncharacterized RDD family membrane protein YckC
LSPSSSNVGENLSHADAEIMPAWKTELSERLAATRTRRLRHREEQIALPGLEQIERKVDSRASQLAAKVAQRYANAPSYSEVLAAEARARAEKPAAGSVPISNGASLSPQPLPESWNGSLIPEEEADAIHYAEVVEEEPVVAAVEPLAVNLIEFPRELVAARKMRPRLAEGPLRETSQDELDQLRIFEVAPESISQTVNIGATPADWSPIRLDDEASTDGESVSTQIPLKTAAMEDRIMAGIFDLALIVSAFAIFVLVFAACTAHPPSGKPAMVVAGLVLAGFGLLYQYLFFKYSEGTPGMRYAKIALCTFEDENPTRKAMCTRVLYVLLSAAPLGLGFAWAWFDPDRLTWHDRLSRIYQRSYS